MENVRESGMTNCGVYFHGFRRFVNFKAVYHTVLLYLEIDQRSHQCMSKASDLNRFDIVLEEDEI